MRSRPIRTALYLVPLIGLILGWTPLAGACWFCVEDGELATERWDETSGSDPLNYPPHRLVDFNHMRLEIDIPDMNEPTLRAKQTLTFTALRPSVEAITLDAHLLEIGRVYAIKRGQAVTHTYDDHELTLVFDPPLEGGEPGGVVIEYEAHDPPEGLIWTPESPAWPGRPAQIHTQGQPETNSYWFPCHDSPNEQLTTEIICMVPEGYYVSSNGRIVDQTTEKGRTRFHWSQDLPHVNYLVSLCIGQWDIVDVSNTDLPMPVYVPLGMGEHVRASYGRTAPMVRVMSEILDEPYPWAQYGQVVVWNFAAGGMENTSVTTMYEGAILEDVSVERDRRRLDSLIAHELGHQWFGDLITCNSWDHIWLNEGFATYMESLWWEAHEGYNDGYLYDTWLNNRSSARRDKTPVGDDRPGMVSREYKDPIDVFRRRSNPYPKGASVLHMLRAKLGDDAFFEGLRTYIDRFNFKTVETSDFRKVMEEVSGYSLERFFQQWVVRPGTPEITIEPEWDPAARALKVHVEQTQPISASLPAFAFELPLHIVTDEGETIESLRVTKRAQDFIIPLQGEPTMVAVDPWLRALAVRTLEHPTAWLINQLVGGPTVPSRLDAAIALRERPGRKTVETLSGVVSDSTIHFAIRAESAESLGELGAGDALLELFSAGVNGNDIVRVAMLDALTTAPHDGSLDVLLDVAQDRSQDHRVRAAAIQGIGELGNHSHMNVLLDALGEASYAESIREAAIGALVELDLPGAIEEIAPFTEPGQYSRLRPVALRAVARLKEHAPELAFDTIAASLNDRVERARFAAASAMAELGDERGLPMLRRLARSHRQESYREHCAAQAEALAVNASEDKPDSSLAREIEDLRQEVEELREMVERDEAQEK